MFTSQDLITVGFLIFLEGILSVDNALVLALLAREQPRHLQKKALTYGLVGAVVFRLIALGLTTYLIKWRWVKFVGGAYLLYISIKHFLNPSHTEETKGPVKHRSFWATVAVIELTDIAFAVDSILAAVALSNKFWVVFTGGFLGVVLMRFAASLFIKLLNRFPNLETTAYLLVFLIGVKVILEGLHLPGIDFHSASAPAFWVFWGLMFIFFVSGFRSSKAKNKKLKL